MKRVTNKTHEDLLAVAEETGQRHGSTMTFVILGKKKYALVQVGDSRAYLSNGNWVTRITKDQTVEEYEKKTGKTFDNLSKERKKHILMQCMGDKEKEGNVTKPDSKLRQFVYDEYTIKELPCEAKGKTPAW